MKKLISVLLTLVLITAALPISLASEALEITYYVEGYYTYTSGSTSAEIHDVSADISGKVTVPAKLNGKPVTAINHDAFRGCDKITSIVLNSGLVSIGQYAFSGCSQLESITLPSTLKTIEYCAFYGSALESITIPANVESMDGAFTGCSNLKSITVNSKNKYFSSADGVLFSKDKTKLISYPKNKSGETYTIPKKVTAIEESAFSLNKNLTSVTITSNIKTIGELAFSSCYSLSEVTICSGVESTGVRTFENCKELKTVIIEDGVKNIGESSFMYCSSLEQITIPAGVNEVGDYAFGGCEKLSKVIVEDGVAKIGNHAFDDCSALTEIVIPNSVKVLGKGAFLRCYNLNEVTLNNGLEQIGATAFEYCRTLKTVVIPETVTVIGSEAFRCCDALETVNIKGNLESLEYCSFADCPKLSEITIAGIKAFDNPFQSTPLKTLIVKDGLETIQSWALDLDGALRYVYLPATIKKIESYAFGTNASIITICYGGTEEQWAKLVTSSNMPKSYSVIYNCAEMPQLLINNRTVVYARSDISGYFDIPFDYDAKIIESIGANSFEGFSNLTSLSFTYGLRQILNNAFKDCDNIKRLYLPSSVTFIGSNAFKGCDSINTVYYGGTEQQWNTLLSQIGNGNDALKNATIIFNADELAVIKGDADMDGEVKTTDLAVIKLFLSGISQLHEKGKSAGDLNVDNEVDTTDLAQLKLMLAGIV